MGIIFSQEEKEQLNKTYKVIIEDLRSLYNVSDLTKISTEFTVTENGDRNTYSLVINKKEMYVSLHYSDWYMNLDKISSRGKQKICPIKDYTLVFEFLRIYEKVRKSVFETVSENQRNKTQGMSKIQNLFNKYTKEAIIEVEMPETNNKPALEITSENGKNVGRVTIGPVSLKILTSENVSIVGKKEPAKVKRK